MYITKEKLLELNACINSITWLEQNSGITTVEQGIALLWETDHPEKFAWSNWILSSVLTRTNQVRYAINSAELVLPLWEKEFPTDKRPHEAVNAVKAWLENPSPENTEKCRQAGNAALAVAAEAAESSAWAAAKAAYDAWYAANAAANAAAYAAGAATWAAWAEPTKAKEIIDFGLTLLQNQE